MNKQIIRNILSCLVVKKKQGCNTREFPGGEYGFTGTAAIKYFSMYGLYEKCQDIIKKNIQKLLTFQLCFYFTFDHKVNTS